VALTDDLAAVAVAAAAHARPSEEFAAVLAAEPHPGRRVYLCAFERTDGAGPRGWIGLDGDGAPVVERRALRDAISIAALCEVAEDSAGGGDLDELRARLVTLRLTQELPGIEEAEDAALALQHVLGTPPHVASPGRLDEIAAATRRLERALGDAEGSPFAEALKAATPVIDELTREIEAGYRLDIA
jgi:hypothetical protein